MTKRAALSTSLVLFFGFASPSVFAKADGARIVYDSTMTNEGQTMKMQSTYLIQDGAVRFESAMPEGGAMAPGMPGPAGKMIMIAKPKEKKYVLLMEAQKLYMEMPEPTEKQLAEASKSEVPFKATGKSKKVAGYSCDVFERTVEGRTEEACASKELRDVFADLEKSLPKGQDGMSSSLPNGLNGFPMEYVVKSGKTIEIQMLVREIKREKIAASNFLVPKDYQKQPVPTFQMMPAPDALKKVRKPRR